MNYALLKDFVYLVLLAFYDGETMPSAVKLSQLTGLTRQTVSKRLIKLNENDLIYPEGKLVHVRNPLSLDAQRLREIFADGPDLTPIDVYDGLFGRLSSVRGYMSKLDVGHCIIYDWAKKRKF